MNFDSERVELHQTYVCRSAKKLIAFFFEEEVLQSSKALWWSRSGRFLAYAAFDDTNVTKVELTKYAPEESYQMYVTYIGGRG